MELELPTLNFGTTFKDMRRGFYINSLMGRLEKRGFVTTRYRETEGSTKITEFAYTGPRNDMGISHQVEPHVSPLRAGFKQIEINRLPSGSVAVSAEYKDWMEKQPDYLERIFTKFVENPGSENYIKMVNALDNLHNQVATLRETPVVRSGDLEFIEGGIAVSYKVSEWHQPKNKVSVTIIEP